MLETSVIFAFACVFIEMYLVTQYTWFEWFLIKFKRFGFYWSLALSLAVGKLFGATGVTVLLAGIFSTAVTTIIYSCGVLKHIKYVRSPEFKTQMSEKMLMARTFIITAWAWITAPVRAIMWCKRMSDRTGANIKTSYSNMKKMLHRG